MRKRIAAALMVLALAGCAGSGFEPTMDVSATVQNGGMDIEIKTNLPEKTVLNVVLAEDKENGFVTTGSGTVSDGKLILENMILKEGASGYDLTVSTSPISMQEASVKEVLGENGEKLKGELVQEYLGEPTVVAEYDLTVHDVTIKKK